MTSVNLKIKNGLDVEGNISATNLTLNDSYPTVQPTLSMNFAKTKTMDSRGTFTRNSIATYFDDDGYIKKVNANVARFDHDPVTRECKGLLVEGATTNLFQYSNNFELSPWALAASNGVIKYAAIGPDGLLSACKYTTDTTNSQHVITQNIGTVTVGQKYTLSVYAKAAEYYNVSLTANGEGYSVFNLNTGTVVQTGGNICKITPVGNGWYKLSIVVTKTNTIGAFYFIPYDSTPTNVFTGNGGGFYLWGAQLELSTIPSSYVPSTDTFTSRASAGSYVNSSGLIASASTNIARYSYNPANLALAPLLLNEPAATNLATYSSDFTNGTWGKNNTTVTANSIAAPDGTTTGTLLTSTLAGTANTCFTGATISVSSNTDYTFSLYIKQGTTPVSFLDFYTASPYIETYMTINWTTRTFTTGTTNGGIIKNSGMIDAGNGWFRVFLTMNTLTATSVVCRVYNRDQGTSNTLTDTLYVWGAQLEALQYPTSYIATTTATVTRSADVFSSATTTRATDVLTFNGTNFSNWYNQNQGSFIVKYMTPTQKNTGSASAGVFNIALSTSTGQNSITSRIVQNDAVGGGNTYFDNVLITNGGPSWDTGGQTATVGTWYTHAIGIQDNNLKVYFNNVNTDTNTSYIAPKTLDRLNITTTDVAGYIANITYYPARLSDAALQNLTK